MERISWNEFEKFMDCLADGMFYAIMETNKEKGVEHFSVDLDEFEPFVRKVGSQMLEEMGIITVYTED